MARTRQHRPRPSLRVPSGVSDALVRLSTPRPVATPPAAAPRRELYLDALRTAAIVRVVTYHAFGGSWLSWVFPAMGIMFALAGGLMVRSLDRQPPLTVVRNRFRRLLPALWLFGAIMVPLMLVHGWADDEDSPLSRPGLLFWVVPVFDPPGSTWGADATAPLWYLRTYLWLVALSPLLLGAFRRWPLPTLLAPLTIVVAAAFGLVPDQNHGQLWDLLVSLGMFAPCWMLGFAHRTGALRRIPKSALLGVAAVCAAAATGWALTHPGDDPGATYDLNEIPLADALWSIAFVLPLLRFAPDASRIGRTPVLGRVVTLVNNRAVTIYLWHNVMIGLSFVLEDTIESVFPGAAPLTGNAVWNYAVIWVLVAICVVVFGWVEDLAAGRTPRLFPVGPSAARRHPERAHVTASPESTTAARAQVQPVTPVRAIGIAGDQTRIAPHLFGAREVAWSPHPNQMFRPGSHPAHHGDPSSGDLPDPPTTGQVVAPGLRGGAATPRPE
ncbi:putative acyltransferase [Cryptosporangium arvum DSM 44712]|uniref:Putative acyltransferase n=1 Tax=Cryptosporangium arvum DSM 44712 TaxID=927661 RepID=A0A010ZZ05_9ACTN|nr:putative acyltransferase [Cryptosporangium arvum DSM 44712]